MALTLNIGKCTLLGNYRENNEDSIDVKAYPDLTVCIVADGMGGQAAGEIASQRAIEVVPRELRRQMGQAASADQTRTIIVAVWRKADELWIASVGDSRAYLVRDGQIEQLTVDHSLAQALVENKTISAADAKEHRFRNVLWKYLGNKEVGDGPEVKAIPIKPGDRFLLCSDGLSGPVPD